MLTQEVLLCHAVDGKQQHDSPWLLFHGIARELQLCQADQEAQILQLRCMLQQVGRHVQADKGRQAPLLCNLAYVVVLKLQHCQLLIAKQLWHAGDPVHVPANFVLACSQCFASD